MAIKNMFLAIFDPRSSIVKSVFDSRLSSVLMVTLYFSTCLFVLFPFFLFGGGDFGICLSFNMTHTFSSCS